MLHVKRTSIFGQDATIKKQSKIHKAMVPGHRTSRGTESQEDKMTL